MFDFLQFEFVQYAIIIALLISVSSALLSPFLVLNEQAMVADGLAHVSFTGLIIGMLFIDEPLFISIPFVIVFSLIVKYLTLKKNVNGDAALGIVSTVALAIGLIIVHKSNGFNRSIEGMLVGSLWTVTLTEIIIASIMFLLVLSFVVFNYKNLLLITYDQKYAKFRGVRFKVISYLLSALTAVLITIGVKTIGTLLISSFVIFPLLIGMQFKQSFKNTLLIGIASSILSVLFGIFIADAIDIPAGSSIVIINALMLIIAMSSRKILKGGGYRD